MKFSIRDFFWVTSVNLTKSAGDSDTGDTGVFL